jgi:hypothetical protein
MITRRAKVTDASGTFVSVRTITAAGAAIATTTDEGVVPRIFAATSPFLGIDNCPSARDASGMYTSIGECLNMRTTDNVVRYSFGG